MEKINEKQLDRQFKVNVKQSFMQCGTVMMCCCGLSKLPRCYDMLGVVRTCQLVAILFQCFGLHSLSGAHYRTPNFLQSLRAGFVWAAVENNST